MSKKTKIRQHVPGLEPKKSIRKRMFWWLAITAALTIISFILKSWRLSQVEGETI